MSQTAPPAPIGSGAPRPVPEPACWQLELAPYARPDLRRSLLDLATSVVPYIALSVAMYLLLPVSYWLTLVVALPAAGFLVRTFIVFHDCAHGSFMATKRANAWLGRIVGLIVFVPFAAWRHEHAIHHATAGDLDRRGIGDVPTLTVAEYQRLPWYGRLGYRLVRNPVIMFGLGGIVAMIVLPRVSAQSRRPRIRNSMLLTNVALAALIGGLCWLIGWRAYLEVQGPTALLSAAAGVWLFYVQHQFEEVYWEDREHWSYTEAALRGSSYLKLPPVLQFFTGNIGLHHVHHLSARIPNYNLQRAHDEVSVFRDVPVLTLANGLRAVRLKLYDQEQRRMVTFAQARRRPPVASPVPER